MTEKNIENYIPEQVVHYWFEDSESHLDATIARTKIWYNVSEERDAEINRKFGKLLQQISNGKYRNWCETSTGALALILVLDQFTRQIYRKRSAAFANDDLALSIVYPAIRHGLDKQMSIPGRLFFYHPFQHSEALADQEYGVEVVQKLKEHCESQWYEYVSQSLRFFEEHCEIIRRFGRFPHRNEVLQRSSTLEEVEFLRLASSYGQ